MQLSSKARRAVATGLALSTFVWGVSLFALPVAVAAPHSSGCLVNSNGTVYLINNGERRGFTSAEVFLSHGYNFGQVITANADDNALPVGPIIVYADGSLVKGPNDPLVYIVANGQKRGFVSGSVFTGLGFSFANIQSAAVNTFADLPTGANMESATERHTTGTLVNAGGTIWQMTATGRIGIPSMAVFNSWGFNFGHVVSANAADLSATNEGVLGSRATCTPGVGDPDTGSGGLNGTVGDVTLTLTSTYSAEDVGEGDDEVGVLSWDVEAGNSSDVRITSVKISLEQTLGTNSDDITDYLDEVAIFLNDTKVGEADTSDFSETSDRYSNTIVLNNAIVRMSDTEEMSVRVSALGTIDSADIDDDAWDVELDTLRFVDGDGVTSTETPGADVIDEAFDVDTFADANDVELTVALNHNDDAINEAHVIDVDDTTETDGVEILSFTLEAEGSDITVSEIAVLLTTTEAADAHFDDPDDIITRAYLFHNGTQIASEPLSAADGNGDTETVTFEDFTVEIDEDDMENFTVEIDLIATDGVLDDGDTIKAEITGTETDLIEAEDQAGNDLAAADLLGTALGEASVVYDAGIMVEFDGSSSTKTFTAEAEDDEDQGTFVIEFSVTAFGDDMYIDASTEQGNDDCAAEADAAGQGVEYCFNTSGAATSTVLSAVFDSPTSHALDDEPGGEFYIPENSTRSFSLTVVGELSAADSAQMVIESINWADATAAEAAGGVIDADFVNYFNFNLDEFKTPFLFLSIVNNV